MKHKFDTTPTSYQELNAYLTITGEWLTPPEVEVFKTLDTAYIQLIKELNQNGGINNS